MSNSILQLYVELVDSEPPIWRCFQVPRQMSLQGLHSVLQAVMGWSRQREHLFKWGRVRYGVFSKPESSEYPLQWEDEATITLEQIFIPHPSCLFYTHDLKAGWLHRIEFDQAVPPNPGQHYPRCIDGAGACPPEDSGGVWGYAELLERLNDPGDPEYEDLWVRIGEDFDPDHFDLVAINHKLQAS